MEGTEHEKTFFHRYKILVMNLILAMVILGVDPDLMLRLPDNDAFNYYIGVFILFGLFLEVAGVWFKHQLIFSYTSALYQKVPQIVSFAFLPRVLFSGAIATLAVESMGGLQVSEFFLVPIVLYAVSKEFWVRRVLLITEREKLARPGKFRMVASDALILVFILVCYFTIWKVYLLENPRLMYMVMSPINWGFAGLLFMMMLYAFQMPLFWENALQPKTTAQKRAAYLTLLIPVAALLGRFYLQSYLRA